MNHIDVTLYFNELRLKAVQDALALEGFTVEDKLNEAFHFFYEQFVPVEQQTAIEAQVKEIKAIEQAAHEAKRRFAVYHVRENGLDAYFTNDHFNTFHLAAYRYCLYHRNELSSNPQYFAYSFLETEPITASDFESYCDGHPNDIRITALIDFDLDKETVGICDSSDNAWCYYKTQDILTAAFKAYHSDNRSPKNIAQIFNCSLAGKEIELESVSETSKHEMI